MRIIISNCTGLGNMILKGKMIDYLYQNGFQDIILLNDNRWGYNDLLKRDQRNLKLQDINIKLDFSSIKILLNIIKSKKKDIILLPFDSSPLYVSIFFSIFSIGKIYIHKSNKKSLKISILFFLLQLLRVGRHINFKKIRKGTHEEEINTTLVSDFINLNKNNNIIKRGLKIKYNKKDNSNKIIIQASSRNGELTPKNWDPNKFRFLINFINSEYKEYKVVMVGDKNESSYIEKIIKGTRAINNAGNSTVFDLYKDVVTANLVICHDSSVMHIADTNNIPCVVLLGPTDFSRTGPKSLHTIPIVSVNQSTMYMYNLEENEETTVNRYGQKYCMENINLEMVKAAIKILLDNKNAN